MMRAVSASAKCRPVPGAPHSRITLRAAAPSVPSTKGRRMARTTLSTKASCPRTVFFTSAVRPSKLPSCSGFVSAVPLASRPSASISRSIRRLSSSAVCTPASCAFSRAFCCFSNSSSCFCCSSSAAFRSGRPLPAGFFGLRLFRLRLCTAELQFAARAEHAVHQAFPIIGVCHGAAPPSVLFSSSIVNCAAVCKHQKKLPPFRGS